MPQHSLLCWSKYFQEHLNIFGEKYLFCCKILPESSSESSPECFLKVLLKVFWKFLLQDSAWKFFWWWSPTACHCSQPLPGSGNNTGKMCHNPGTWYLGLWVQNGSLHLKLEIPVISTSTNLIITSVIMSRLVGFEMGLMLICLFLNNPEAQVHFGASKTNSSKRPNSP